jgi:hypothetical protein
MPRLRIIEEHCRRFLATAQEEGARFCWRAPRPSRQGEFEPGGQVGKIVIALAATRVRPYPLESEEDGWLLTGRRSG